MADMSHYSLWTVFRALEPPAPRSNRCRATVPALRRPAPPCARFLLSLRQHCALEIRRAAGSPPSISSGMKAPAPPPEELEEDRKEPRRRHDVRRRGCTSPASASNRESLREAARMRTSHRRRRAPRSRPAFRGTAPVDRGVRAAPNRGSSSRRPDSEAVNPTRRPAHCKRLVTTRGSEDLPTCPATAPVPRLPQGWTGNRRLTRRQPSAPAAGELLVKWT